jgi:xanthine dehydrogenase YagR molybdenum-binding subunit
MTATVGRAAPTTHPRVEGLDKVTGRARYAVEHGDDVAYAWPVTATVGAGRVTAVDADAALARPGVLAVLWHGNAPRLGDSGGDAKVRVLQSDEVAFRGQVVALVVATSSEQARETASALRVTYDEREPDAVLRPGHPTTYAPEHANAGVDTDSVIGDAPGAFAAAPVRVDATYTVPSLHNHPLEPHSSTAVWDDDGITVHDSTQGGHGVRQMLARLFEVDESRIRVLSAHVGGGFGSKGTPRPNVVLAVMAARAVGRAVRIALTRQQLFDLAGYRAPTIQRLRLGADTDGRLRSISHEVLTQTATVEEFVEQACSPTRVMYAAEHRLSTHRVATLDVSIPSWMRAPGECPGMYALESAMDELAHAAGVDPVELRLRNEPEVDPELGVPFSSRNLVACLHEGARRFGWADRDPRPGVRRDGRWLVGTGMAASTYPTMVSPATARATAHGDGSFSVGINATDIGTGARTAMLLVAADELGVDPARVRVDIGDTDLPQAPGAGGSAGTSSWGSAVAKACRTLLERIGDAGGEVPDDGIEVTTDTRAEVEALSDESMHAFGAQFVEARVDTVTGEVRVPRMTGVFAAGRIVNERTARSQLIGGMTMGLSMALHEHGVVDARFGGFANHDLSTYHVATAADVGEIDVSWLLEEDSRVNLIGTKGIGEIGIVGAAAAVANAVFHATGVRVRDLPITPDTTGQLAR